MSKPKPMKPIPGTKEQVGLYKTDIDDLDAKVGDWVKVEYTQSGSTKKINSKVREVDREAGWKDNLIWLSPTQLVDLGIKEIVASSGPPNPPSIEVDVTKYTFYPSPAFISAVITVIVTAIGIFFKWGAGDTQPEPLKTISMIGGVIVLLIGPLSALLTVYLHKQ